MIGIIPDRLLYMEKDKNKNYAGKEKYKGRTTGFEPATYGTTIHRSNQLSYDRHKRKSNLMINSFFRQEQKFERLKSSKITTNQLKCEQEPAPTEQIKIRIIQLF